MAIDFEITSAQCILFSGSSALRNVSGATLMAWAKMETLPTAPDSVMNLIDLGRGGSPPNYPRAHLGIQPDEGPCAGGRCLDDDTYDYYAHPPATVAVGIWYHIAAKFNYPNKKVRIYQDGIFLSENAGSLDWSLPPTSDTDSQAMAVGGLSGDSEWTDGLVDDARVYARQITDEELRTIVAARGVDGIVRGLRHRWLLNEKAPGIVVAGAGSVIDRGILRFDGTPVNSPVYAESSLSWRRRRSA